MKPFPHKTLMRSVALGLISLPAAAPAFATEAIPVPEPSSLSLLAAGVAGAVIAIRLRKRK